MPPSSARIPGDLKNFVLVLGAVAVIVAMSVVPHAQAAPTPDCSALSANVLERVKPANQASSLTLSQPLSARDAAAGFTSPRETSMRVAPRGGPGLSAVHRLSRSAHGGNLLYSTDLGEIKRAVEQFGYTDQGVVFYAATAKASCLIPVWSYFKAGVHRFVTSAADQAMMSAAGWRRDAVRFYVGRPAVDPTFTFAVYPDTQQEVLRKSDRRFVSRSQWLVRQRKAQDLRFVTHTGDVVNWDTADHAQYAMARDAMAPLEKAGIPYSLSIGNHDTAAVCAGGGACDSHRTRTLVRDTRTFNRYLNRQSLNQEGAYEAGRVDNSYHVYTAGGLSWLVLNLELWQRPGALRWAQRVVQAHPRHNVIVVTHAYLTATGRISTKAEYGDTAPSVLARELVKKYPNVRMVFSGHVGQAAHRVDKGVHGNRIDSFVVAMHSNTTNPIQMVRIDTKKKTLTSWVYAPLTNTRYPKDTVKVSHIRWVR